MAESPKSPPSKLKQRLPPLERYVDISSEEPTIDYTAQRPRPSIGVRFRASLRASAGARPKTLASVLALAAAAATIAVLKAFGIDVHIPPGLLESFQ